MSAESIEPKPERRLKRGDVREDGKVFWAYGKNYANGERWVTRSQFDKYAAYSRKAQQIRDTDPNADRRPIDRKLRRGEARDDGRLFWGYDRKSKGGERWLTPEQFEAYKRTENRTSAKNQRTRRAADPMFSLRQRIRCATGRVARLTKFTKPGSSFALLGTDFSTFKRHIEDQFSGGMSWENFSEWHIDHKIPLSSAKTLEELWRLAHYSNLQPLWAADNLRKGAKLPDAK